MKKFFFSLIASLVIAVGLTLAATQPITAQGKVFTLSELQQFDGQDGRAAYFAFEGQVYDVTTSKYWKLGEHFGLKAGQDLTGKLAGAPHGTEVFSKFPLVGTLESAKSVTTASNTSSEVAESETANTPAKTAWYEGRLTFLGFSILGWTGIFLAIFFVLTFGTCFAMPWAKLPLPWKGTKIGPDALDTSRNRMTWSSIHKHFVWWLVLIGVVHGVLGFMQMLGIYL